MYFLPGKRSYHILGINSVVPVEGVEIPPFSCLHRYESPTLGYSVLQSDSDVIAVFLWFAELHVHLSEEMLVDQIYSIIDTKSGYSKVYCSTGMYQTQKILKMEG
jgi:hypothetical protein